MCTLQDERLHFLALSLVKGLGNKTFKSLIAAFGTASAVFDATLPELSRVKGIREGVARRIHAREFVSDPEEELLKAEKMGVRIVPYNDPEYPSLLKEIDSPPMLLFWTGRSIPGHAISIGVVGSRNASSYGMKAASDIGYGLGNRDAVVVSGLARGIDSAAHRGCLRAKGFTVAVMGTGIDMVYPTSNMELMEQIIETGAVISEFPMGTMPEPRNFPIRNRIISGLSRGVVVVEATLNSGSLITARLALEQNREVFAVPGSIASFKSRGTHFLIKQGAKLVENAEDVLEEFSFIDSSPCDEGIEGPDLHVSQPGISEEEKKVLAILDVYPVHIDSIVRKLDMDAGKVLSILMKMELDGYVVQLAGNMFARK